MKTNFLKLKNYYLLGGHPRHIKSKHQKKSDLNQENPI